MNQIFLPALYLISGVYAYSALNHGLSVLRNKTNLNHLLFAILCLLAMAFNLLRAGAYQAQTLHALVELRRWEVSAGCMFLSLFPWLIANYTGVRPRRLLIVLTVFWPAIIAVNLILPYGIQFAQLPTLSHFTLPWGENIVDLRANQPGFWLNLTWIGIFAVMSYSVYACFRQYRAGMKKRAISLARALAVFFVFVLFDALVDWRLVEFVNMTDFGFLGMLLLMDMDMLADSRDQYRRMSDILDHIPVAVFVKDLHGRYQFVNREFEELFKVSDTDVHGKTVFDIFPGEQAEIFQADDLLAIEQRRDIENEVAMEYQGKPCALKTYKFPLLRPDGSLYAMSGVYIDITESRQKDDALNRLHRQVWHADRVLSTGALAGSLAHELSQPLSAILNNAQAGLRFMAKDHVDLGEIREILQDIVRDDKRAAAVINGLRSMLQQREVPQDDVDLVPCIEEVLELLHSEFVRLNVAVERMLEARLTVKANKTQIQQVLINLIMNALEAMTEQEANTRTLRIATSLEDGKARVSVRDNGTGIPEKLLDRVFDGFYTTKPQGLGMGLEVCRSIVESHRGTIRAENNPDRGATFHFTLPYPSQSGAPSAPAAS
jgi:PAS domain S-box-containing protein